MWYKSMQTFHVPTRKLKLSTKLTGRVVEICSSYFSLWSSDFVAVTNPTAYTRYEFNSTSLSKANEISLTWSKLFRQHFDWNTFVDWRGTRDGLIIGYYACVLMDVKQLQSLVVVESHNRSFTQPATVGSEEGRCLSSHGFTWFPWFEPMTSVSQRSNLLLRGGSPSKCIWMKIGNFSSQLKWVGDSRRILI